MSVIYFCILCVCYDVGILLPFLLSCLDSLYWTNISPLYIYFIFYQTFLFTCAKCFAVTCCCKVVRFHVQPAHKKVFLHIMMKK